MKKLIFIIIMCAFVAAPTFASYVETFDSSNAGWLATTVDNGGGNTYPAASWSITGGNPGGYISGTVDNDATRLYGLQPANANAYGDMTGLMLTTDYKIDGTVTGPSGAMVRFYIGTYTGGYNYFVSNDTFSWNPNGYTDWTTFQVALQSSNFSLWPNQNAGTKTFAQVVANPEDIGLVFADGINNFGNNAYLGFSSSGGATISIDNFGIVPLPATILLGLLGLGIGGWKLRKSI